MKTETKYKKCCLCIISKNKKLQSIHNIELHTEYAFPDLTVFNFHFFEINVDLQLKILWAINGISIEGELSNRTELQQIQAEAIFINFLKLK